jgi:hypothetical protein
MHASVGTSATPIAAEADTTRRHRSLACIDAGHRTPLVFVQIDEGPSAVEGQKVEQLVAGL